MSDLKELLNDLHQLTAAELLKVIREGIEVVDKEGNVVRQPAPATYYAQAIALLRQNNIQVAPGVKLGALAGLQKQLGALEQPEADLRTYLKGHPSAPA